MMPVVKGEREAIRLIVVNTLLVPLSFVPYLLGTVGAVYFLGALVFGSAILITNLRLLIRPGREEAWRAYKFSSPYLALLLAAMILDVLLDRPLGL